MKLLHSFISTILLLVICRSTSYAQQPPVYSCMGSGGEIYSVELTNPNATDADNAVNGIGANDGLCDYTFRISTGSISPLASAVRFIFLGNGLSLPFVELTANDQQLYDIDSAPCGNLAVEFNIIEVPSGTPVCQIRDVFMPVELVRFEAKPTEKGILLNWETASEINNLGFDVERSTNGKVWKQLEFVKGHLTTLETQQYEFVDHQPYDGESYYRLKQMDVDGKFEYSEMIVVNYNNSKSEFSAFPNPAREELTLSFVEELEYTAAKVAIFNNLGQLVKQEPLINNNLSINDLASGIYLLTVNINKQVYTMRFVKK
ncbi:MAG: T9SS type A sorting domain-containing protein [Bacteroidota bacterium]